jgi:hypothetical protein
MCSFVFQLYWNIEGLLLMHYKRFRTYNLPLDTATPEALAWMKKMWEDPCLKRLGENYWKQAEDPESLVPDYENMFKDIPGVTYGRVARDWKFEP